MKKAELIKKLNEIAEKADDILDAANDARKDAQRIVDLLEELPSEEDEIE